jgi:hypothetical protein
MVTIICDCKFRNMLSSKIWSGFFSMPSEYVFTILKLPLICPPYEALQRENLDLIGIGQVSL